MSNEKWDWLNPHSSSHKADTLPKLPTHEQVILVEYQLNWIKIVDFLLIAYFWVSPIFYCSYLILFLVSYNKRYYQIWKKRILVWTLTIYLLNSWNHLISITWIFMMWSHDICFCTTYWHTIGIFMTFDQNGYTTGLRHYVSKIMV